MGLPPKQTIDLDEFDAKIDAKAAKAAQSAEFDDDFYGSEEFNEDEFDAAGFEEMSFDDN